MFQLYELGWLPDSQKYDLPLEPESFIFSYFASAALADTLVNNPFASSPFQVFNTFPCAVNFQQGVFGLYFSNNSEHFQNSQYGDNQNLQFLSILIEYDWLFAIFYLASAWNHENSCLPRHSTRFNLFFEFFEIFIRPAWKYSATINQKVNMCARNENCCDARHFFCYHKIYQRLIQKMEKVDQVLQSPIFLAWKLIHAHRRDPKDCFCLHPLENLCLFTILATTWLPS